MSELMRTLSVGAAPSAFECACLPGTCRGGEVIGGRTANGMLCKAERRRSDEKAQRDKIDERLASGLLRSKYGPRARFLAARLDEVSERFIGIEPMRSELRETAQILRALLGEGAAP